MRLVDPHTDVSDVSLLPTWGRTERQGDRSSDSVLFPTQDIEDRKQPHTCASDRYSQEETHRLERRAGTRQQTRLKGTATFLEPSGRLWLARITLINHSQQGAALRCLSPVKPGARCIIELDDTPVVKSVEPAGTTITGKVVHAKGRGGSYCLGMRYDQPITSGAAS